MCDTGLGRPIARCAIRAWGAQKARQKNAPFSGAFEPKDGIIGMLLFRSAAADNAHAQYPAESK